MVVSNFNTPTPKKKGRIMKKYRPTVFDALFKTEQRRLKVVTLVWYVFMVFFVLILFLAYLVVTN